MLSRGESHYRFPSHTLHTHTPTPFHATNTKRIKFNTSSSHPHPLIPPTLPPFPHHPPIISIRSTTGAVVITSPPSCLPNSNGLTVAQKAAGVTVVTGYCMSFNRVFTLSHTYFHMLYTVHTHFLTHSFTPVTNPQIHLSINQSRCSRRTTVVSLLLLFMDTRVHRGDWVPRGCPFRLCMVGISLCLRTF